MFYDDMNESDDKNKSSCMSNDKNKSGCMSDDKNKSGVGLTT